MSIVIVFMQMIRLQSELEELEREYKQQFAELEALDAIKEERKV